MNHSILIESWKRQTIKQLPKTWSDEDYQALLELLDVSDVPQTELKDYVLLALSDLDKPEAAIIVLGYLLGDKLTEGQIQNAAHELEDEKLWEEYPDISLQKSFFQATTLLYEAFNGGFPQPKAEQITFIAKLQSLSSTEHMEQLSSTDILRLLSAGFDDTSLMSRLFEKQLKSGSFPEANGIIWHKTIKMLTPDTFEINLISSEYWLEDFAAPDRFQGQLVVIPK